MSTNAPALDFDPDRLKACLRERLGPLEGPMRLERIGGGQSNPTFFVSFDNRSLVLRKQPGSNILPSAHAVDREARIMQALATTDVPVPTVLFFHAERDVVGTPFYVMERLHGRVFAEYRSPELSPADRRAAYLSMADTLAKLHRVDWNAIGLADYGKPGNYYERQIARWTKQWRQAMTDPNPWLEKLVDWLPRNMPPPDDLATICHGDFRLGNLMLHASQPRVIAVLDWELSTLGHPLADLAYNVIAWHTAPEEYGGIMGLDLPALGIPTLDEYLERYYAAWGRRERMSIFHLAFALFRIAVIFEGIAARALAGNAASSNAAQVGKLRLAFARRGVEVIGD